MPVPTSIADLSTTASSNSPSGSEARSSADDYLRTYSAFIRALSNYGSDIASAGTITPAATASAFNVTGTTAITAISSSASWNGREVMLRFTGALTLTHSSNLVLPGAANITTASGDIAKFVQASSGTWYCVGYSRNTSTGTFTTLTVTGSAAIGSDLTINTNKFSVAGTTGNTVVGGTFESTGAALFDAGSTFSGAATFNGGINLPVRVVAGSDSLVLTDAGGVFISSAITTLKTLTLPANATVAFPIETVIWLQLSSVATASPTSHTLTAAGGVTINGTPGKAIVKTATDTWSWIL